MSNGPGVFMVFRLNLVSHTPPTASEDTDAVAAALLRDIGYLPGGLEVMPMRRRRRGRPRRGELRAEAMADPPRPGEEVLESVPYRLVRGCLLKSPARGFTVEELERELGASRPTVYRHLAKLKELDLLSHGEDDTSGGRRRYALRYGSLSRAWRLVEANAECALASLRGVVDLVWEEATAKKGDRGEGGPELRRDRSSTRVTFHLPLLERPPVDPGSGLEDHLLELLQVVRYLPSWSAARKREEVTSGVPYRLFKGCLLDRPERSWTARELMAVLDTTKPTLYRHVRKLEALDILERGLRGESPRSSKGFRLRYGNLSMAWNFTEEHAKQSLRAYRETVEHLEGLLGEVDDEGK